MPKDSDKCQHCVQTNDAAAHSFRVAPSCWGELRRDIRQLTYAAPHHDGVLFGHGSANRSPPSTKLYRGAKCLSTITQGIRNHRSAASCCSARPRCRPPHCCRLRSLFNKPWRNSFRPQRDRKSTRLNSSHQIISYAVFCLKKKKDSKLHEDRQ